MKLARTFKWAHAPESDDEEVFSFNPSERFIVEGDPPSDDFLLGYDGWNKLGKPPRIKVTVEAAE